MNLNRMKQTGACLCLVLAFISSCKSPMYVPPSVNIPMMDSAGQVEGRLGYRNANLNVSVSKKMVVTAQVQWLDKRGNSWGASDGDLRYTMRNTLLHPEFGVGYFGNWNGLKYVVTAGGGFGQMHYITHVFDYRTRDYQYDLHTQNYSAFLMPSIRLTDDVSEFEVYASLRMRSMWYHVLEFSTKNYDLYHSTTKVSDKDHPFNNLDFRNTPNRQFIFLEPALTARQNLDFFYFQMQTGLSSCLTQKRMDQKSLWLEFSIGFRFGLTGRPTNKWSRYVTPSGPGAQPDPKPGK